MSTAHTAINRGRSHGAEPNDDSMLATDFAFRMAKGLGRASPGVAAGDFYLKKTPCTLDASVQICQPFSSKRMMPKHRKIRANPRQKIGLRGKASASSRMRGHPLKGS